MGNHVEVGRINGRTDSCQPTGRWAFGQERPGQPDDGEDEGRAGQALDQLNGKDRRRGLDTQARVNSRQEEGIKRRLLRSRL